MYPGCPHCNANSPTPDARPNVRRDGKFKRKSDSRSIQRFYCRDCKRTFSRATTHPDFRQKKRLLNYQIYKLLTSGVSQRRTARLLGVSRTTVVRKLCLLGERALTKLDQSNLAQRKATVVEFDDMETFEHTKCKPLSITLAVESRSRRILGFEVSKMPAKGKLSRMAIKKYGPRKDERTQGRRLLFKRLVPLIEKKALIKSDQNPHYPKDVKKYFPAATHETHKGQRGSVVGQGELKKIRFDPLFSLNHTCAMYRANVNRLFRRTWCTTKLPKRLTYHLAIYSIFHNEMISPSEGPAG